MKHRSAVVAACLVVASLGLAGIGGVSAGAATKSQSYDKSGILKRPLDLSTNGGLSFDPANMSTGEYVYTIPVTASWLKRNVNGSYSNELASKVDSPDALDDETPADQTPDTPAQA